MAYADYAFYSGTWHGTMPEADFDKWADRASLEIDRVTFDRAAELPTICPNACSCAAVRWRTAGGLGGPGRKNPGWSCCQRERGRLQRELERRRHARGDAGGPPVRSLRHLFGLPHLS